MKLRELFVVSVILVACDHGVDLENPPVDQLVSVSCFISPQDTTFKAHLYKVATLKETVSAASTVIPNAVVTITHQDKIDTLLYDPILEIYIKNNPAIQIETGETYNLLVTVPEINNTIKSSCVIPPAPGIITIEGVKVGNNFEFSATWINEELHPYYSVGAIAKGKYTLINGNYVIDRYLVPNLEGAEDFPSNDQRYESYQHGNVPNAYLADTATVTFFVLNIEENVYDYFKTFQDYENWRSNNLNNLIPNLQRAQPVFSNIEGGVGIFAGFNQSSSSIQIQD